jgi:assimilatory nitrate reductase catalytic subunit
VRDSEGGGAGALAAALYVTRSGELPPRDWAADQLGLAEASPAEFLAGRPCTPQPDRGPVVCICHGVGENTIVAACAGAAGLDDIGQATQAGTNCGSCRPAIARLLDAVAAGGKGAVGRMEAAA